MKIANTIKYLSLGTAFSLAAFIAPVAIDKSFESVGIESGLVAEAYAQNKKKTRKLPGIKESVLKKLGVITEFINPNTEKKPDAKPDLPKALRELQKMEKFCANGKCNKYEIAQMWNFYGYAYYQMDNTPKAIESYKKVIAQSPEIPYGVELAALFTLAQLEFSVEKYDDSLKHLNLWKKVTLDAGREVTADVVFFEAQICYTKGDKKCALVNANKAIKMKEDAGRNVKEGWYSLQLAIYLEREQYRQGEPILEKLIRLYPKVKWWTQYSNVNGLLEKENDQMNSLNAVYTMGGLKKRQDIVNLTYLYLGADAPFLAAKVLDQGMKEKNVDRNVKYLKILGGAWRAARESKKAITVFKEAAKTAAREDRAGQGNSKYKAQEGNIHAELVGLYLDVDDMKSAVASGKDALKAGKLKRACEVHTNMGIAYTDMGQYKSAVSSFKKASGDKQCRALVANWIRYAENEARKAEELRKSLEG